MNRTTKIILTSIAVIVLLASAVTVKLIWFPSVKEAWFQTTAQRLRQVQPGIVVVRPTHFPKAATNSVAFGNRGWMSGRNVTFQTLVGLAYSYDTGRVYIPPTAPKNNYDFVITALSDQRGQLRAAIQKKTGYIANVETRDTDVLVLKVEDPNSSGLKVSDASEKQGTNLKNGRLYFTHMKLDILTGGLGDILKMPVVDKTGLTNFYDFSLQWKVGTNPNNFTRDQIDKILADWGLGLEPDTASIEMLVVKKGH